jgi:hypothetical protein
MSIKLGAASVINCEADAAGGRFLRFGILYLGVKFLHVKLFSTWVRNFSQSGMKLPIQLKFMGWNLNFVPRYESTYLGMKLSPWVQKIVRNRPPISIDGLVAFAQFLSTQITN